MHFYTVESSRNTTNQPSTSTLPSPRHEHTSEPLSNATSNVNDTNVSDDAHQNYELFGVIVHRGTAEYGHYYSFIKHHPLVTTAANSDKDKKQSQSGSDTWFRFDDTFVLPFDPSVRQTTSSLCSSFVEIRQIRVCIVLDSHSDDVVLIIIIISLSLSSFICRTSLKNFSVTKRRISLIL